MDVVCSVPQKSTGWYALTGWLSPHIADKRYRLSLLALHHPCWMSRLMWLEEYLKDIQYIVNYFSPQDFVRHKLEDYAKSPKFQSSQVFLALGELL